MNEFKEVLVEHEKRFNLIQKQLTRIMKKLDDMSRQPLSQTLSETRDFMNNHKERKPCSHGHDPIEIRTFSRKQTRF